MSRLLEQAWRRGWAPRPNLHPEQIVASAQRRECGEARDGSWQERLDLLCRSLHDEADLNAFGLTAAYVQLVKLVRARIRADRLVADHPEIETRQLGAPVVIVGQMRSGTTRIHRLLACDRRFAVNRMLEQLDPVPYARLFDPRPLAAAATGLGMRLGNPSLTAIHPSAPGAAEEDFGLHAFSIWGALFEGQWRVPAFARHVEQADAVDVYREFALLLRIASAHRHLTAQQPWLLKAPQFAQELD
ncbi:MAG: sulfotransferase, partial [Sphingomicrobium sp.]